MAACTSFRLTTGTPDSDQSFKVREKTSGRHEASQGHGVPEFRQACQNSFQMLSFHQVRQNPSQP